jgi:hypothetical protein
MRMVPPRIPTPAAAPGESGVREGDRSLVRPTPAARSGAPTIRNTVRTGTWKWASYVGDHPIPSFALPVETALGFVLLAIALSAHRNTYARFDRSKLVNEDGADPWQALASSASPP